MAVQITDNDVHLVIAEYFSGCLRRYARTCVASGVMAKKTMHITHAPSELNIHMHSSTQILRCMHYKSTCHNSGFEFKAN